MTSPSHPANGKQCGSTAGAPDAAPSGARQSSAEAPPDPLAPLLAHLAELREYGSYLLTAQLDQIRQRVRMAVLYGILAVLGCVLAIAVLSTAAVLLLDGAATGLGLLLGGRIWLGQLLLGAGILIGVFAAVWIVLNRQLGAWHKQIVEKYEHRKQAERTIFGTDVDQRAQQQPRF